MIQCEFCNREFKPSGIAYHKKYCKSNPNKIKPKKKSQKWLDAMARRRGKVKNQWADPNYSASDETRQKLSKAGKGRKHTQETKEKLSKIRKEFLAENPEMVPYKLNHYSNGPSYPEIYWKGILDAHNINYVEEYPVSFYSLDFAIIDRKIDLEIDGSQHYLDERIIESDKQRTKYLESFGWTVIRINWSDYQKLDRAEKEKYVKNIIEKLRVRGEIGITPVF